MAGNWRKIAIGLRLPPSIMKLITSQNLNDPELCLFTALEDWLKQLYNTKKYGNPSWRMLVKAVASLTGGANPALAKHIAEKHPGKHRMLSQKKKIILILYFLVKSDVSDVEQGKQGIRLIEVF